MRIIGYLDTREYKTTVFKNNERFIVKFEAGLLEQTFKFDASDQIQGLNDIRILIDAGFQAEVSERFKEMHESKRVLLYQYKNTQEEEWEEII